MLKITRNKNVKYIHTENIRYVVENPDGQGYLIFTVSGKDEVVKNEFDPEKAGLVKCGNCYYNVECICDVEVIKTRDAFIVSPNFGFSFSQITYILLPSEPSLPHVGSNR